MILRDDFYQRENVTDIARELLGKIIFSRIDQEVTGGIITETEAYAGVIDRASHAFNERRTSRTKVMYKPGGVAYIYLCYGIHHLFNFVTGPEEIPHAVLLRGIYPRIGLNIMEQRRNMKFRQNGFSDGPGKVTQCLGLSVQDNGKKIGGDSVWVEDCGIRLFKSNIYTGPRIGVDYAGEDALLPYRFLIKDPGQIKKPPEIGGFS